MVEPYSVLLMTVHPPHGERGRPSPVFAVPVLLYLLSGAVAAAAGVDFPGSLVAALVLLHLAIVLGGP
jgi:hypothetical protein